MGRILSSSLLLVLVGGPAAALTCLSGVGQVAWRGLGSGPARNNYTPLTSLLSNGNAIYRWEADVDALGVLTAGDVDGDRRLEIVAITSDCSLISVDAAAGSVEWSRRLECSATNPSFDGVYLADLDRDGLPEAVVYLSEGRAVALDGDGSVLWSVIIQGGPGLSVGQVAVLALDLDADGAVEVVVPSGGRFSVLDGLTGAREGEIDCCGLGPLSAHDLDGDGIPELLILEQSGVLYCLDGRSLKEEWSTPLRSPERPPGASVSFPLVADLDGDGRPEIAVAVGGRLYGLSSEGGVLWITDLHDPVVYPVLAAGDADRDGSLEVFLHTYLLNPGPPFGRLVAVDGSTGELEWSVERECAAWSSPLLADADGDSRLEVVNPHGVLGVLALDFYDAATGGLEWRLSTGRIESTILPADVDGDGLFELLFSESAPGGGGKLVCLDSRSIPGTGLMAVSIHPSSYVVAPESEDRARVLLNVSVTSAPLGLNDGPLRIEVLDGPKLLRVVGINATPGASAEMPLSLAPGSHDLTLRLVGGGAELDRTLVTIVVATPELSVSAAPGIYGASLKWSLRLEPPPASWRVGDVGEPVQSQAQHQTEATVSVSVRENGSLVKAYTEPVIPPLGGTPGVIEGREIVSCLTPGVHRLSIEFTVSGVVIGSRTLEVESVRPEVRVSAPRLAAGPFSLTVDVTPPAEWSPGREEWLVTVEAWADSKRLGCRSFLLGGRGGSNNSVSWRVEPRFGINRLVVYVSSGGCVDVDRIEVSVLVIPLWALISGSVCVATVLTLLTLKLTRLCKSKLESESPDR